jgi:hypothetical protein
MVGNEKRRRASRSKGIIMPNSIEKSEKYLDLILELYKLDSLTADLDSKAVQFDMSNANIVKLLELATQGLGDYERDTGYPTAAVTAIWRPYTLEQDRGIRFTLDRADSEETLGLQIGAVAGDFTRMYLKPELDTYRFSKYAKNPKETGGLTTTTILNAIDTASQALSDAEVPDSGQRVLFINQNLETTMKAAIPREWTNENELSTKVLKYNGMEMRFVPSSRFKTGITLNPGASGSFGYASTGDPINFIMLDSAAIWQVTRFANAKFVNVEENQNMDSHLFMFRIIHDCGLVAGKEAGIYAHVNEA